MKFQQLLRIFTPPSPAFYTHFTQASRNVAEAALVLMEFAKTEDGQRKEILLKLEEFEHRGDEITHCLYNDLSTTFVTPIDREDIHDIASNIDDIIDLIYAGALNIQLYRIKSLPQSVFDLIDIIKEATRILVEVLPLLAEMKEVERIEKACVAVNSCENRGDDVFHNGIAQLFEENEDPLTIIKLKDILNILETAIDKCENVANLIENIVIKYA